MTTEEFKKKIKEIGFESINRESGIIDIFESDYGKRLAGADVNHICVFDLCGNGIVRLDVEKRKKLAKVVIAYAMTPIKERNPKRYFRYQLKPISNTIDSLLYYLKYDAHFGAFVLESIDVCNDFEVIFEENDPLLKDVNLKLFVAEEVDQEGNEL